MGVNEVGGAAATHTAGHDDWNGPPAAPPPTYVTEHEPRAGMRAFNPNACDEVASLLYTVITAPTGREAVLGEKQSAEITVHDEGAPHVPLLLLKARVERLERVPPDKDDVPSESVPPEIIPVFAAIFCADVMEDDVEMESPAVRPPERERLPEESSLPAPSLSVEP